MNTRIKELRKSLVPPSSIIPPSSNSIVDQEVNGDFDCNANNEDDIQNITDTKDDIKRNNDGTYTCEECDKGWLKS